MCALGRNVKASHEKIPNMSPMIHPFLAVYGLIIIECLFWIGVGYFVYKRKGKKKSIWHE